MDPIFIAISFILAKSQALLMALGLGSVMGIQLAAISAIALTFVGLLSLAIYSFKKHNKKSVIGSPVDNDLPPSYHESNQPNFVHEIPPQAPPAFEHINEQLPPVYVEPITVLTVEVLRNIICSKFTLDQDNALEKWFHIKAVPELVDATFDPYAPSRQKIRFEITSIFLTILSHKEPSHELTKNEFESFIQMSRDLLSPIGKKDCSLSSIKWIATLLIETEIENSPYIEFANSVPPSPWDLNH